MNWKTGMALFFLLVAIVGATAYAKHRSSEGLPSSEAILQGIIARLDTDNDGRISKDEWKEFGGGIPIFDAYDFDGDGYLSVSELDALVHTLPPRPNYLSPLHY